MQNYAIGENYATVSAAGTTQATATLLAAPINNVTTVASGAGVLLPLSALGYAFGIYNSGANPLKIYPNSGAQINGVGNNNAVTLATNTFAEFSFVSSGQWFANVSA